MHTERASQEETKTIRNNETKYFKEGQGMAKNDEEGLKEQKQNPRAACNKEKTEQKDERVRQTLTHSADPASVVSLLSLLSVSHLHLVFSRSFFL